MPSVDGHELKDDDEELLVHFSHKVYITSLKPTLVGQYCPSCRRMVDGPYAGRTFDVPPWEGEALVGVEDA